MKAGASVPSSSIADSAPGSLPGRPRAEPAASGRAAADTTPTSGPPSPAASERRRHRLVYILGTGRCGSTVLEVVLGSHPQIQSTGEFRGASFLHPDPEAFCACGEKFDTCTFWGPIRQEYRKYVDFDHQLSTRDLFEDYGALPRMLAHRVTGSRTLREHVQGMADYVRVVSRMSGKEVVLESSKSAARGYLYALARSPDFDVRFLHLVRDGRGYMYSKTTVPDRAGARLGREGNAPNPWEITLRWVLPNVLSKLLCSRPRDHYLRVRYEDFIQHPAETLEQIGRFIGVDMTPVIATVRDGRPIRVDHLVGGNRLRFNGAITLESRFTKVALGTPRSRLAFWVVGGWMAFLYGYPSPGRAARGP